MVRGRPISREGGMKMVELSPPGLSRGRKRRGEMIDRQRGLISLILRQAQVSVRRRSVRCWLGCGGGGGYLTGMATADL